MGWGSSTRRGGGRKLRARPRNFVFLGFRREESGMSREFCRDVPDPWRCSKSLCKKTSCAFFVPYIPKVKAGLLIAKCPISEKLQKAVAVSNPGAFPKAGPIFQQPLSLLESVQTVAGIALCAAGESGKNFQQRRNLPENPSRKSFRTATTLSTEVSGLSKRSFCLLPKTGGFDENWWKF